jgi:hypothetical protein
LPIVTTGVGGTDIAVVTGLLVDGVHTAKLRVAKVAGAGQTIVADHLLSLALTFHTLGVLGTGIVVVTGAGVLGVYAFACLFTVFHHCTVFIVTIGLTVLVVINQIST